MKYILLSTGTVIRCSLKCSATFLNNNNLVELKECSISAGIEYYTHVKNFQFAASSYVAEWEELEP